MEIKLLSYCSYTMPYAWQVYRDWSC